MQKSSEEILRDFIEIQIQKRVKQLNIHNMKELIQAFKELARNQRSLLKELENQGKTIKKLEKLLNLRKKQRKGKKKEAYIA